jgi:hypothetical protein
MLLHFFLVWNIHLSLSLYILFIYLFIGLGYQSTFFKKIIYLLALATKARILCLDSLWSREILFYHTPLIVGSFKGFLPLRE